MLVPRRGPGVCRRCFNLTEGYAWCWPCVHGGHSLDAFVPISYSVSGGPLHAMLAGYKRCGGPQARAPEVRLGAVLWRYLELHERCLADAASVDRFDLVTTVPSSDRARDARPSAAPGRRSTDRAGERALPPAAAPFRRAVATAAVRRPALRDLPGAPRRFRPAHRRHLDDRRQRPERGRRPEGRRGDRGRSGGDRAISQRGLAGQPHSPPVPAAAVSMAAVRA